MIQKFFNLVVNTSGQRLYEITDKTIEWIEKNNFTNGMLNMSIQHTSASLIVQENADPDVQTDLINYFDKLVPMDEKLYIHSSEGKDDMPAHIKSALTNNQISLSIKKSKDGSWVEANYKDGKLHGEMIFYGRNGKKRSVLTYENGQLKK